MKPLIAALGLYILWVTATWFFEGRIHTLLRPEAVGDRLAYGAANLLIGIVGAALVLRLAIGAGRASRASAGFGPRARTAVWVPVGLGLGLLLYLGLRPPTVQPMVIVNAYAQVFPVSAAEIVVCWAMIVGTVEGAFDASRWAAGIAGAAAASVLFGVYHFGHSPPFNSVEMVAFLTLVGLITSTFFFVSRDVYATVAFHNFLGVLGVTQALAAEHQLERLSSLQPPLLAAAVFALLVLVASDNLLCREAPR